MSTERQVEDVVETLRKAHDRGSGCVLLIGAGCSKTAGIPLASEFVDIIKKEYPQAYKYANPPTYANCMEKLSPSERKSLIARYVDTAKINWAHIAIAQLIKHGYVDRVLTTNFDPLVIRACAMVGEFPAVYDSASSQLTEGTDVHDKSVFYLHGQRTGFLIMNTQDEVHTQAPNLAPVFKEAGVNRIWLVVGYSGENDPVFKHLSGISCFKNNLYWVGYRDAEPSVHVREQMLTPKGKYSFFVRGHDADSFLIKLAQELSCFPPKVFAEPAAYLAELKDTVLPFPLDGENKTISMTSEIDRIISLAKPSSGKRKVTVKQNVSIETIAKTHYAAARYDEVIHLYQTSTPQNKVLIANLTSWALIQKGIAVYEQARTKPGAEAIMAFEQAAENYQHAVKIKSERYEAWNNWGNALLAQAGFKTGEEADRLFAEAGAKYEQAIKIKADHLYAWHNWGLTLDTQARTKTGTEADRLFAEAYTKYGQATKVKADYAAAWNSWASALDTQARTKTGTEADRLFAEAYAKFEQATKIKADDPDNWNNWGNALLAQAGFKTGEEADRLFAEAGAKYEQAIKIKADHLYAWRNWGLTLDAQARTKTGTEADRLFAEAYAKFEQATKVKTDDPDNWNSWGSALNTQARTKTGADADRLFAEAGAKYEQAIKIKTDNFYAWRNWGLTLDAQARTKAGTEADRLFAEAYAKFRQATKFKAENPDNWNNWGSALLAQAGFKTGEEADQLIAEAESKIRIADELQRGTGTYNLACIAALRENEAECERLLRLAAQLGKLPKKKHVKSDPDLAALQEKAWFQEIIKLCPE